MDPHFIFESSHPSHARVVRIVVTDHNDTNDCWQIGIGVEAPKGRDFVTIASLAQQPRSKTIVVVTLKAGQLVGNKFATGCLTLDSQMYEYRVARYEIASLDMVSNTSYDPERRRLELTNYRIAAYADRYGENAIATVDGVHAFVYPSGTIIFPELAAPAMA